MLPTDRRVLSFQLLIVLTLISAASGQQPTVDEATRPVAAAASSSPNWLSFGATYRVRFEGRTGDGYVANNDDYYGLGRLLVDVGIEPSSWLNFHFQGQDARSPGKEASGPGFRDPFDVRQAWVQIGDPEAGVFNVQVGRQELKYGAQRLIGPLDWTNTARQFDAAKVTIGHKDLGVDVFAGSVVRIDDEAFNRHRDGENLHGIYGNLGRLIPGGSLEAYGLWKTNPLVRDEIGIVGDGDTYTTGLRFVRPLPSGFDMEFEVARQFGTFGTDDISAWGGYAVVGFTPHNVKLQPRFSVEYQYGSGDSDQADGRRETFDQLYPTGHLYQGAADRIGWQNVSDVRTGVALTLHKKLKLKVDYFSFWLANRNDHLYAVNGRVAVRAPVGGALDSHIGEELDATFTWTPASHVAVGGGVGQMFPGAFLKQTSPAAVHTFPYLFLNYKL